MNQASSLKNKIFVLLFIFLLIIFIPLLATIKKQQISDIKLSHPHTSNLKQSNPLENCFCVKDESTNQIIKIPDREFLYGAVAYEMPALFENEALKAQAVACYTYFCRQRKNADKEKNPSQNYQFTVNTAKGVTYVSPEQMKVRWGNNFEKYYQKIKECVDAVFPEVLEEKGDLILAVYHAMSSGKTEKSADVFGGDLSYLTNVESPGDTLSPDYETTAEFSKEEFKQKISSARENANFSNEPSTWVKDPTRSPAGMVKQIEICKVSMPGTEIRKLFSLRSSNFEIKYDSQNEKFIFTVKGYGHGVGMSQNGAQYMAKQGADYKKILSWYYPNTSISDRKVI